MKKQDFLNQAEQFASPTYYSKGANVEQMRIYAAMAYRWEDTADPIIEDREVFFSKEEAEEHADNLDLEIGFSAQIQTITFTKEDFEKAFDDQEEDIELDSLDYKTISSYDIVETDTLRTNNGNDITGAIIVEWSWDKYPGYCRNLSSIGIAGEFPFHDIKTEEDLITGNEDRTFLSNYDVLLSAEEVSNSAGLVEDIKEALNNNTWKWNYFKNNPNTIDLSRFEQQDADC